MNSIRYKVIFSIILFLVITLFNPVYSENFIDYWIDESKENELVGSIYMEGKFLDKEIIKVTVYSEGFVSPVLGVAFHLNYEGKKLEFLKYEPGKFLESGGDPLYLVDNNPLKQKIYFGATLRREDNFPMGGDKLVDFYFQNKNSDDFVFEFKEGVVSTLDTVRQDIDEIEWRDLFLSSEQQFSKTPIMNNQTGSANIFNTNPKLIYIMLIPSIFTLILIVTLLILFFKYTKRNSPLSSQ